MIHKRAEDTYGFESTSLRYYHDGNTFGNTAEDVRKILQAKNKMKMLQRNSKASHICFSLRPSKYPYQSVSKKMIDAGDIDTENKNKKAFGNIEIAARGSFSKLENFKDEAESSLTRKDIREK